MSTPAKVTTYLDKLKVPYERIAHRTVYTAYDLAQTLRQDLQEIAKTLLIKVDTGYALVVLPASSKLDFKKLKKLIKAKKVSIASEKEMQKKFNVKPGAMTPFGALHKVPVVVDKGLAKASSALFSAGSFTESLRMKVKDYIKGEQATVGAIGVSAGLKLQAKPKKTQRPHAKKRRASARKKSARRTAPKRRPRSRK